MRNRWQKDGFLFNVEKFFGSTPCQRMSFTEKGVYLVMLFQEWWGGALPDSPEAVADLVALRDSQAAEVVAAWPVVRRNFVPGPGHPNTIMNVVLENTRVQQRRYLRERSKVGKKGGEAYSRNL